MDSPTKTLWNLPAEWYLNPEIFLRERKRVFLNHWQYVGRTAQVATPNSFFTTTIVGAPLIVVRTGDNMLRAFINACCHKGARVEMRDACTQTRSFRCRYHGWTYNLDGRLIGAPEMQRADNFEIGRFGLTPLRITEWGPLLFATLNPDLAPLSDYLGPMNTILPALKAFTFVTRRIYEVEANWKVYIDNYLDGGYHIPTLHPKLATILPSADYATHIFANTTLQTSPIKEDVREESLQRARGGAAAQYWWAFPNVMLNLYAQTLDLNFVIPISETKTQVVFDFFAAPMADLESFMASSIAIADDIQAEDAEICADIQQNYALGAFDFGPLNPFRESGIAHFQQKLSNLMASG